MSNSPIFDIEWIFYLERKSNCSFDLRYFGMTRSKYINTIDCCLSVMHSELFRMKCGSQGMNLTQERQIYSFKSLPIKHCLHFKILVLFKTHPAILWLFQNTSIKDAIFAARKKSFLIHPLACKEMRFKLINFPLITLNTFLTFPPAITFYILFQNNHVQNSVFTNVMLELFQGLGKSNV